MSREAVGIISGLYWIAGAELITVAVAIYRDFIHAPHKAEKEKAIFDAGRAQGWNAALKALEDNTECKSK